MTVSYPGHDHDSPLADAASLVRPGHIIGPYRLRKLLGEGSTGRVFEVEHLRIGRRAAMKIVHTDCLVSGAVRRMFAEAEAVNAIGNPHVVEVTDLLVPTQEHAVHALVMELLEGTVLAELIARRDPLPMARLLPIMAQVCDALSAVHAAGFVHRDLKPENVFLIERDGNPDFVKLLDFGLVKAISADAGAARATIEGTFVGSPAYASPEQAAGKPVDWRTDAYAVGVMLYELATGRLPFEAETIADVLVKHITQPPPRLPDHLLATEIGRSLDEIIQTCLAKDPEARAIPATQLAGMLSQLAAGNPTTVRAPKRRLRLIAPALAVAGAAALVLATQTLDARRRSAPAAQAAAVTASAVLPATATPAAEPPPAADEPKPAPRRSPRRPIPRPEPVDKTITLDPYR